MNEVELYIMEKRDELELLEEEGSDYGEDELKELSKTVQEKFGVQCELLDVGGFDSPGYAVSCYALIYIGTDGVLGGIPFEIVSS